VARPLPLLLVLLAAAIRPAAAQVPDSAATLRGTVVAAATSAHLPFAVVVLEPAFRQRFTDDRGGFVFTPVLPGTYHLLVRQLGYTPFDTTLTIGPGTPPLRIALRPLALELNAITVAASVACTNPGRPDASADPALAAVFGQLEQNAERSRLLRDAYPFRYTYVRELTDLVRNGNDHTVTDTVVLRSDERWHYAPGRVVTEGTGSWRRRGNMVHLPVLADFADDAFQRTHCFRYAGREPYAGRDMLRIDFTAAERLREPDVNGSAWLDPDTFQIHVTIVTLTHLSRAARGVTGWEATTVFRAILPNLPVTEHVSVVTSGLAYLGPDAIVGRTEQQRLIAVTFLHGLPGATDSIR
jgi:hypothetical protein